MKALFCAGLRKVAIREVPDPEIQQEEILISVDACGLSGADISKLYFNPRSPDPFGTEVAGTIAACGPGVSNLKEGDRIAVASRVPCLECHFCRGGSESMCREYKQSNIGPGGFSQLVRVSAHHVRHAAFKLPPSISAPLGVMLTPLARSIHTVRRLALGEDDCALIIGLGVTGLLTARLLIDNGVTLIGIDTDPARVKPALKFGLEHAYSGKDGRTLERIHELSGSRGADAVIFTAGDGRLVAERFDWARDGGTVALAADFPAPATIPIDLNILRARGLTLQPTAYPALEDLREAHRMITAKELDLTALTRGTFPLDKFEEALRQVRGHEIYKVILLPQRMSKETAAK